MLEAGGPFHDVRRAVFERADVERARDVLVLDLRGGARLAGEPRKTVSALFDASGRSTFSATR